MGLRVCQWVRYTYSQQTSTVLGCSPLGHNFCLLAKAFLQILDWPLGLLRVQKCLNLKACTYPCFDHSSGLQSKAVWRAWQGQCFWPSYSAFSEQSSSFLKAFKTSVYFETNVSRNIFSVSERYHPLPEAILLIAALRSIKRNLSIADVIFLT